MTSLARGVLSSSRMQGNVGLKEPNGWANVGTDRTSELNNLLQIISSTSELIRDVTKGNVGCAKYVEMLRESVERATEITTDLVRQSGGCEKKALLRPDFSDLIRSTTAESPLTFQKSILVVDDEPMALGLAKQVLSEANFRVTTACSGFECIELCRDRPNYFDLVVLDLSMPDMTGEETFARLRGIYPDLSIVISTGYIAQEKLNQMLASGLTGFIRKPLPPSEYVGHIRSILEKARFWQNPALPRGTGTN